MDKIILEDNEMNPAFVRTSFDEILAREIMSLIEIDSESAMLTYNLSTVSAILIAVERDREIKSSSENPPERFTVETLIDELADIGLSRDDTLENSIKNILNQGYLTSNEDGRLKAEVSAYTVVGFLDRMFPGMQGMQLIAFVLQMTDEVLSGRKSLEYARESFAQTLKNSGVTVTKEKAEKKAKEIASKQSDGLMKEVALKLKEANIKRLAQQRFREKMKLSKGDGKPTFHFDGGSHVNKVTVRSIFEDGPSGKELESHRREAEERERLLKEEQKARELAEKERKIKEAQAAAIEFERKTAELAAREQELENARQAAIKIEQAEAELRAKQAEIALKEAELRLKEEQLRAEAEEKARVLEEKQKEREKEEERRKEQEEKEEERRKEQQIKEEERRKEQQIKEEERRKEQEKKEEEQRKEEERYKESGNEKPGHDDFPEIPRTVTAPPPPHEHFEPDDIEARIAAFEAELATPCPICHTGKVKTETTNTGKTYYICSDSNCRFVSWSQPYHFPCPLCKNPFLVEFQVNPVEKGLKCPRASCSFSQNNITEPVTKTPVQPQAQNMETSEPAQESTPKKKRLIRRVKRRR
ncbi:MAG: hypothetical protein HQK66_11305 [Desulfamplus sp.]|nr:hypothetical protein [Desulfamplus sp.]